VSEVRISSLDLYESKSEIAVLPPDARELTDEVEGDEKEINTDEIIVNDAPVSLKVRT
ncbi:hypothetical protein TNCT_110721, partial [Trichonephila clavata]